MNGTRYANLGAIWLSAGRKVTRSFQPHGDDKDDELEEETGGGFRSSCMSPRPLFCLSRLLPIPRHTRASSLTRPLCCRPAGKVKLKRADTDSELTIDPTTHQGPWPCCCSPIGHNCNLNQSRHFELCLAPSACSPGHGVCVGVCVRASLERVLLVQLCLRVARDLCGQQNLRSLTG